MTPRIVTFCNADYIPVAQNWFRALGEIDLDGQAVVVSLDDKTRRAFPSECVLHRPLPLGQRDLGALWMHRIVVLREILSAGEAVVHSDADAVWLRDPMPYIYACAAPVVFSQGTVWPPDVHSRHGLVLCCGFFYLAPDTAVLGFLDAVAGRAETDKDDQIAANREVAARIERWEIEDPYEIPFKDTVFLASRWPIRARGPEGRASEPPVAILPHHAFPRLLDEVSGDTVVAHPLSGKTLQEKEVCLSRLGIWSA